MITVSLVKEAFIEAGKRFLKVIQYGAKTADVVAPFGEDSAPLKDMIALYAETAETGDSFIIGYINSQQIAQPGEKRIFSLQSDGSLSIDIHLKADGTMEIGGNSDFAVRYNELNAELQLQNTALNLEFSKIAIAINALAPGSYVPSSIGLDLSGARNNEVKTN